MIYADPGPFADVASAATAEHAVDWWDADERDDRACTESFAAMELRQLLAAALRIPAEAIPVRSRRAGDAMLAPSPSTVFLLGDAAPIERAGWADHERQEAGEAFRIHSARTGTGTTYSITGAGRVGTLYGVYAFLGLLGVHQDGLGARGLVMPAEPPPLPEPLDVKESPAFATRGFWAWEPRGTPEFFQWMARNRMNLWTVSEADLGQLAKLGIRTTMGGHDMQFRFLNPSAPYPYAHGETASRRFTRPDPYPPSPESHGDADHDGVLTYFEAHPEWYGLFKGTRSPSIGPETGDNYCTSNPYATAELAGNIVDSLASGTWRRGDVLVFWMHDNGRWCECASCARLGPPSDRLFHLLGQVQDSLRAARDAGRIRPGVRLSTLAFMETILPPVHPVPDAFTGPQFSVTFFPINRCYAHALSDPRCDEINQWQMVPFAGWAVKPDRTYRGEMEVGEYYNVDAFKSLPIVLTSVIGQDIPFYWSHGVRHFTYMHVPTASWGPWMLDHVLLARLLWDPTTPASGYVSAVLERFYPATHAPMATFYEQLERAMANLKLLKHQVRVRNQVFQMGRQLRGHGALFPYRHLQLDAGTGGGGSDLRDISDSMARARAAIVRALEATPASPERERILEDGARFEYGDAMIGFLTGLLRVAHAHDRGDSVTAVAEWPSVERSAGNLRTMRDVARASSSHANAESGFDATGLVDVYESYRNLYGASADTSSGPR